MAKCGVWRLVIKSWISFQCFHGPCVQVIFRRQRVPVKIWYMWLLSTEAWGSWCLLGNWEDLVAELQSCASEPGSRHVMSTNNPITNQARNQPASQPTKQAEPLTTAQVLVDMISSPVHLQEAAVVS